MKKRVKKLVLSKDSLRLLDGPALRHSVIGGGTLHTCRMNNNGEEICVNLDETTMYPGCE